MDGIGRKTFCIADSHRNIGFKFSGPGKKSKSGNDQHFVKPRALSRQTDERIKVQVHRDKNILNHMQSEQKVNMNLMFYDFNGSQMAKTTQNFYPGGGNGGDVGDGEGINFRG